VDNFAVTDSGSAVAVPTVAANWLQPTGFAIINNTYGKVRPICAGIRVVYTGNTINDQGILLLGQVSGDVPVSQLAAAPLNLLSNVCQFFRTYPLRSGGTITWRPDEMDDIASFVDTVNAGGATTVKPATPYLIAWVFGAASAGNSTVVVERIVQFQGQYITQSYKPGGPESSMVDATQMAEPGWYEKAKNFATLVEPIMPFVKASASNLLEAAVGSYAQTAKGMLSLAGPISRQRLLEL
jgi:hypothetical protein